MRAITSRRKCSGVHRKRLEMDREHLENAALEVLQKEAIACGLPFTPDRAALIESILSYRERNRPPPPNVGVGDRAGNPGEAAATEQLRQTVELLAQNMRQMQQEMFRQ